MDTTNDYNDEPDYDQMIAEDQRDCGGPEPPSDDDTEDHMREEYNAGDRAAKRYRLGPEPTDETITNHANGNRATQATYLHVNGSISVSMAEYQSRCTLIYSHPQRGTELTDHRAKCTLMMCLSGANLPSHQERRTVQLLLLMTMATQAKLYQIITTAIVPTSPEINNRHA